MKRTVLVVDDETAMRRLLYHALRDRYRVLEASDFDSAIAAIDTERVDLVLLDLHLPPRLDLPREGLRICDTIRARSPEIPLVVVSSNDDPAVREALLSTGVRGFLGKPVDAAALSDLARTLLGG